MTTQPSVRIVDNRLITTSIDIARHFGKKHKDVLRATENLDCSAEFNRRNFTPIEYTDDRGRTYPAYEITKNGFMFLAMGFTGANAAVWKERYINAFDRLELQYHQQQLHINELQTEVLRLSPLWSEIIKFKAMRLNHVQIGKLVNRAPSTVRRYVRRIEACGLLTPPANLIAMQSQLALNFGGSHA